MPNDWIGTVDLCKQAKLTRNELYGLRLRHPDKFPTPARVGPSLLWPAGLVEVVLSLIELERGASHEVRG